MFAPRVLIVTLLCAASTSAFAQTYPARAARMVVPWTAGGTADLMARIASQKFSESFGQQFIVDNRPGAGGLIGTEQVAKAAPDGLTLLPHAAMLTRIWPLPPRRVNGIGRGQTQPPSTM